MVLLHRGRGRLADLYWPVLSLRHCCTAAVYGWCRAPAARTSRGLDNGAVVYNGQTEATKSLTVRLVNLVSCLVYLVSFFPKRQHINHFCYVATAI